MVNVPYPDPPIYICLALVSADCLAISDVVMIAFNVQ